MEQIKYLIEIKNNDIFRYCGRNDNGFTHCTRANEWDAWDVKEYGFNDYKKAYNEMQKLKRFYKRNHYSFDSMRVYKVKLILK